MKLHSSIFAPQWHAFSRILSVCRHTKVSNGARHALFAFMSNFRLGCAFHLGPGSNNDFSLLRKKLYWNADVFLSKVPRCAKLALRLKWWCISLFHWSASIVGRFCKPNFGSVFGKVLVRFRPGRVGVLPKKSNRIFCFANRIFFFGSVRSIARSV